MKVFVGWDASSSMIGVCALQGEEILFWHNIDLSKCDSMSMKYKHAALGIMEVYNRLKCMGVEDLVTCVIEERLGGFSGGFTTQQTLMTLAAINAVVTSKLEQLFDRDCVRYAPQTVKSVVKLKVPKGGSKKEAAIKLSIARLGDRFPYEAKPKTKKEPYTEGHWKTGVDDLADAYLLALTAQIKDGTRT